MAREEKVRKPQECARRMSLAVMPVASTVHAGEL
jgi:hypothetical protein